VESRTLEEMQEGRRIVSEALELRSKANVRVRQPLRQLSVVKSLLSQEYLELIKNEVNVKEITFGENIELDTEITDKLKVEGIARELMRNIQDLRKKRGYLPHNRLSLRIATDKKGEEVINKFRHDIIQTTGLVSIVIGKCEGEIFNIEGTSFCVGVSESV
jgi:isoleucyl-tRNA synthetase